MSDADEQKPQVPKPSRLAGLIAPKGAAARPSEPAPAPPAPPETAPAAVRETAPRPAPVPPPSPAGTGSKSLTLRLPDAEYERLRTRAYTSRMSHQAILAEALRRYLDEVDGQ